MTVIHIILMDHNIYITMTSRTATGRTDKAVEAGVQTSYVHSSIIILIHVSVTFYMPECCNNLKLVGLLFFLHVNVNYVLIYPNSFYI